MALASAQIIDAIAARLSGLPLAGIRVYTSRAWPLSEAGLPAWRVVAVDEDVEPLTVHRPAQQQHRLQVEVQGYARATADLDDALHALASEALTALLTLAPPADALAGLNTVQFSLRRIERAMQPLGEASLGLITITLRADFRTASNAPDTII